MKNTNRRASIGLIFIVLGLVFLLDNLGQLPVELPPYIFQWPVLLILIGVFQFFTGNRKSGIVEVMIGVLFILSDHYPIDYQKYWPVLMLLIGVGLLFRNWHRANSSKQNAQQIDDLSIFGSSRRSIITNSFNGGKLTAVFGSVEIDLRQSSLAEGQAVLDTFASFGAIRLLVPEDWVVNFEATTIMGDFEDKRVHKPTEYFGNVLTIKGLVIMGSADLNN